MSIGFVGKVLTVFDRDASGEIGLDEWLSILGEDLEMEEVEVPDSSIVEKPKEKAKEKEKEKAKGKVVEPASKPK
jgi:hypothetical protein